MRVFWIFCDKPSAIKYLETYDKLYILKSMTKFYSSAGIRVGTIVSTKENIEKTKKIWTYVETFTVWFKLFTSSIRW